MIGATYKRADLRDIYVRHCAACGHDVVMGLPYGERMWRTFEPIPDGGAPGSTTYQQHSCAPRQREVNDDGPTVS